MRSWRLALNFEVGAFPVFTRILWKSIVFLLFINVHYKTVEKIQVFPFQKIFVFNISDLAKKTFVKVLPMKVL